MAITVCTSHALFVFQPSSKKVKDSPATSDTVAMATSDSAHPNDHITPPRSDGHHDNSGCRSDQRKSTGRNRHRSRRLDSGKSVTASLIDFSQPPADEEVSTHLMSVEEANTHMSWV